MEEKQNVWRTLAMLILVVAGNVLYALSVKAFLMPAGLVTGGTTGIALAMNQGFGVPVSLFVLIFNVVMLIVGYLLLGKTFAITTIISTFTYPAALEAIERLVGDMVITQDILLCTLFSGLCIGLSLGIVIRAGASTGGMDIPPLVLNRYFRIPVSVSLYFFDIVILLAQSFWSTPEKLLYGILLVMTYTAVLDKLMLMGTARTEVKVVTRKHEEMRNAILKNLDRGVTLLYGEGGHLHEKTQIVLSIISNRELPQVEKLIRAIDPESFMVVSRVSEVRGRGFSMSKKYQ